MNKKYYYVLLGLSFCIALLFGAISCNSNIEYATESGFELSADQYRSDVNSATTTRIRVYLNERAELRDNYYVIKFFSLEGDGKAYYDRELKIMNPNEWYIPYLSVDKVTNLKYIDFHYTPYSKGTHKMTLSVRDKEGVQKEVFFKFDVK